MSNSFRKMVSLILALTFTMSFLFVGMTVYGDDLIAINASNFSDPTFREIISSDEYDKNGDGYLSAEERDVDFISLVGMVDTEAGETIKDLKGIEFFTNLTILRCGGIGLESLDVSALTKLTSLTCQGNLLTELDVSNNMKLITLNCSDNRISNLQMPITSTLTFLHCYANNIAEIDVHNLTNLTDFRCDQNELTELDLYSNRKLTELGCSMNHLTSLDLSATALEEVTEYMIGEQTVTVQAALSGSTIVVPFVNRGVNTANYRGCSLDDYDDGAGFEFDQFVAYDVDEIKDGIDYACYPMIENAADMTVHIDVVRDFYQVNFYTDDTLTQRIGKAIVKSGGSVTAPAVTDAPQCKTFDGWSDSFDNVTEDKDVYIIFKDAHNYAVTALAGDKDTVTVSCKDCKAGYDVSFISIVNTTPSDEIFDEYVDINHDKYINAKDYEKIYKQFGR